MLNWILIPVVSAFIGYVTNYLAIKMIFRPLKPVKILGFTILGLIPRRQAEIAVKLGEVIESNLISQSDVATALQSGAVTNEAAAFLSQQVDVFADKLAAQNPMIGMFLKGDLMQQLKAGLDDQLKQVLPQFMGSVAGKLEGSLSFKDIVRQKIEQFDAGKLEKIIYEISARELRAIEVLGGVLGFVIGVLQVLILGI